MQSFLKTQLIICLKPDKLEYPLYWTPSNICFLRDGSRCCLQTGEIATQKRGNSPSLQCPHHLNERLKPHVGEGLPHIPQQIEGGNVQYTYTDRLLLIATTGIQVYCFLIHILAEIPMSFRVLAYVVVTLLNRFS